MDEDELSQYVPSWQSGQTVEPPDTEPLAPAYGQSQPIIDPDMPTSVAAPPPMMPPAPPPPSPPDTLTDIIIVFNGTAYYCTLLGDQTGPV